MRFEHEWQKYWFEFISVVIISDGSNIILSNKLQHHFSKIKNELKHVHLLMIELENLNFGFQRTDINH